LKEFVGLRSSTVYDINKYESVLWFSDIPQEPECQSPAWNSGFELGDPWLEVRKQQFSKPPGPPSVIWPWLEVSAINHAEGPMPNLRPTILEPDLKAEVGEGEAHPMIERRIEEHPEISEAYERYRPSWEQWASEYQRRARIQSVYADLFRLHTQVEKQGEILELVLGVGLVSWRGPSKGKSATILRHVVVANIDLHFESATGVIRVVCAADGAQLKIEDDMLEPELRPDRNHYAAVSDQLKSIGDDVWNRPLIETAIKSWAGALHPDLEWSPNLKMVVSDRDKPTASFAPALILRRRTQFGMVRVYNALIDQLSRPEQEVPAGWAALVDDLDDQDSTGGFDPPTGEPRTAPITESE
jgi:hypothetical protein